MKEITKQKFKISLQKAQESLDLLEEVIDWVQATENLKERDMRLDSVAKRFEVSFESTWKALMHAVHWRGEEAFGPRDTLQMAEKHDFISNIETWCGFLEARNYGVHDYFGLSSEEYFKIAADFLKVAQKEIKNLTQKLKVP